MKAELITNEILDEAFLYDVEYFQKQFNRGWNGAGTSTTNMAKYLWKKYRVPIWKQRSIVQQKIRAWWSSKPRPTGSDGKPDIRYRIVCGYIIGLGSPMNYAYCLLEKAGPLIAGFSILTVFDVVHDDKTLVTS